MDIDLSPSEDIAIGIEAACTTISKDVIALTTTKNVAFHMTVVHLDMGLTRMIDSLDHAFLVINTALFRRTSTNRSNLTTTKDTVTDDATPHRDMTLVNTTVIIVTTTKEISTVGQAV